MALATILIFGEYQDCDIPDIPRLCRDTGPPHKAGFVFLGLRASNRARFAGAARAGPFKDGEAAYQSGDYETAVRLWRPLADRGDAGAQSNLGEMYANGRGVPQDYAQAVVWFRKAADQGDAGAQRGTARFVYSEGRRRPGDNL
jgi:TPR repeat protein